MKRSFTWWLLALAVPALALFALSSRLALIPEPFPWRHLQGLQPAQLLWEQPLDFHGGPNLLFTRLARLLLLHQAGLDFSALAVLPWAFATIAFLGLCALGRRTLATATDPRIAIALILGLGCWIFSPLYGASWLLGERFSLFVPATLAILATLGLRSGSLGGLLLACALSLVAALSHDAGCVVWIGLIPLVAEARRLRDKPAIPAVALWGFFGSLGVSLSRFQPTPPLHRGFPSLSFGEAKAWDAIFAHAGRCVPQDLLSAEHTKLLGAILLVLAPLLVTITAVLRKRSSLLRSGWPTLALCGAALCVFEGCRLGSSPADASMLRELSWGVLLLPLGLVGSALTLLPRPAGLLVVIPLAGLAIHAGVVTGWSTLDEQQRELDHDAALYHLSRISDLSLPTAALFDEARLRQLRDGGVDALPAPLSNDALSDRLKNAPVAIELSISTVEADGRRIEGSFDPTHGPGGDLLLLVRIDADGEIHPLTTGRGPRAGSPWHLTPPSFTPHPKDRLAVYSYDVREDRLVRARGSIHIEAGAFQLGDQS